MMEVFPWWQAVAASREADLTVPGYLDRWVLAASDGVRAPARSALLHRMIGPDVPVPHNHPWPFRSFVLAGGYVVMSCDRPAAGESPALRRKDCPAGATLALAADRFHYIESLLADESWTLVVTGEVCQEWGFWQDGRFYPHTEFLPNSTIRPENILRNGYLLEP